jgi:trimethylamine:corrinoid methyltransferase-like protein
MDTMTYPEWIKLDKKDCIALAQERIKQIIENHIPEPLPDDQEKEIEKILDKARKQYGSI